MAWSRKAVVWTGLAANAVIASAKLLAAAITGSAGMLAEGIHSLVDASDGGLLLFGEHLSEKPADDEHPFGHGREVFFWSFMVALMIFAVGGGVSIYRGIRHLIHPVALSDYGWSYAVLAVAFLFDGGSWVVTYRKFRQSKPRQMSIWRYLHASKDPTIYTVFSEDTADLLGLALAFLGVFIEQMTGSALADGIASVLIGCVLSAIAFFLGAETRSLLLGEGADRQSIREMRAIAADDPAVDAVERPLTMQLAPRQVLVVLGIRFREGTALAEQRRAIHRVEGAIRGRFADVQRIYIEAR